MTYNPNVCTPSMFEDELRALASSASFVDPQLEARLAAVGELRRAIRAVREIPGWSGESADTARGPLERMEKNASIIETTLEDLRTALAESTASVAGKAAVALTELPSASAEGFLADAGRSLSGVTDGWGVLDTGEAVAREEARLATERESVAITKLKHIREALTAEAKKGFDRDNFVDTGNAGSIPLPIIDVEAIDRGIPPVGSNRPGTTSPGGIGGFPAPSTPTYSHPGNTFPTPGSTYPNPGGTDPTPGVRYPSAPGDYPSGGPDDPTADSPAGGVLPGTPGGPGGWNPGGSGSAGGAPGGYLSGGGSGGSGGSAVGGAGSGLGGAAALLGGRAMASGGLGAVPSMSGVGGIGGMGGAAGGATTAGRGLLGATGAATGSSVSSSGAGASASGSPAAGNRPGGIGMMGSGAGGDSNRKGGRSTLGGPIAPELDIEDDERPRSRGARAGSRNSAE